MITLNNNQFFVYNKSGIAAVKIIRKFVPPAEPINNDRPAGSFQIIAINTACNISIDGIFYAVQSGDCLVFSSNESMICSAINSEVEVFIINIMPFGFLQMLPEDCFIDTRFFSEHSIGFSNRISADSTAGKHISGLISDFAANSSLEVFLKVISILKVIYSESNYPESYKKGEKADASYNKKLTAVKKAEAFIDNNLSNELSLKIISESLNLSPNYLSAVFKGMTGVKLWDYISEKRILNATKLLTENPDESVLSVALACGYNNCANFNRVFKKVTGITPKEYRTKKFSR